MIMRVVERGQRKDPDDELERRPRKRHHWERGVVKDDMTRLGMIETVVIDWEESDGVWCGLLEGNK